VSIHFACPSCKSLYKIFDRDAGRKFNCRQCGQRIQVPLPSASTPENKTRLGETISSESADADTRECKSEPTARTPNPPPLPLAIRQSEPSAQELTDKLRYVRPACIRGDVIGLERIQEQYVKGQGYLSGSNVLAGSYHGGDAFHPATGSVYGHGQIQGAQAMWTEFRYETRFFVRQPSGIDQPVRVEGDALQLLDGHVVTAVVLKNDYNEQLMCAVVNHSTAIIHWTTTEQELERFVAIPKRRRVREQVLTSEERDEKLRRHNERLFRYYPWLLALAGGGVLIAIIGAVLLSSGIAVGSLPMVIGIFAAGFSGVYGLLHFQQAQYIKNQPLTETISVPNRDLRDEIDAIVRLVGRLR
jgi:hypothetical protein